MADREHRRGLLPLLVPMLVVLAAAALLQVRFRLDWPAVLVAAALYGLAAWAAWRLAGALAAGRWREVLLAAVAAGAGAAVAETGLRILRPYESLCRFRWLASSRYHHVNPPGRRMLSGYVDGRPVVVETNEDGFRTAHTRSGFRGHAPRVAVLGDSFVFGSGVDGEAAFPALLERRLRLSPAARAAAVLNAGVISYSPFLERRVFADVVAQYQPTLVLLFLDVTDIGDDEIYARKAGAQGVFDLEGDETLACHGALHQLLLPLGGWLKERALYPADLVRAAAGRPPRRRANYYADPVIFEGQPENRYFIYRHALEKTRPYYEQTLRNVEAVAAEADRIGARFVVVVFPRYHHWSTRECPRNWERGAYADDEPYEYEHFRFFAQAAGTVGFPVIDLLPAFKATAEFPLVFPHDPHWNAKGHDFVARQVAEALAARALVP